MVAARPFQAVASRLPDGNEQNLQQFLNQSAWDPVPTQRRIAEWMLPLIGPMAWVIDDVSVPKDGRMPGRGGPAVLRCTGNRRTVRACVGSGSLGEMISFRWQAET
ncbi:hypothetical protein SNOUR_10240 [Streptomyces noursei ATCC 11455]|nr:hypothetical protein SNOUR_10240 [Streptomyces noursei ATCC 11455]